MGVAGGLLFLFDAGFLFFLVTYWFLSFLSFDFSSLLLLEGLQTPSMDPAIIGSVHPGVFFFVFWGVFSFAQTFFL